MKVELKKLVDSTTKTQPLGAFSLLTWVIVDVTKSMQEFGVGCGCGGGGCGGGGGGGGDWKNELI